MEASGQQRPAQHDRRHRMERGRSPHTQPKKVRRAVFLRGKAVLNICEIECDVLIFATDNSVVIIPDINGSYDFAPAPSIAYPYEPARARPFPGKIIRFIALMLDIKELLSVAVQALLG